MIPRELVEFREKILGKMLDLESEIKSGNCDFNGIEERRFCIEVLDELLYPENKEIEK